MGGLASCLDLACIPIHRCSIEERSPDAHFIWHGRETPSRSSSSVAHKQPAACGQPSLASLGCEGRNAPLRVACTRYATTQIMLPIPQVSSTSIPDDRQPLGQLYHAALSQSHFSPQERFRRSNTSPLAGTPEARTLSCIMHSASQRRSSRNDENLQTQTNIHDVPSHIACIAILATVIRPSATE